ncbi:citrate lyase subunit gamma (acyl carrier protein) [Malonomonas rubra DSM 5091]|uniref:Citrate lyase subunit gamma (Acyl carrier protein) n=1 Tax=Malonomonas rubra DSM 5091 TaxID=1122189 RepID=A0A1M6G789_MALRU|nr:citrate lyase acyl carrier protein [Malonomonas rubra]SHJ05783.1 citrate lyase subunit gamma (acyl carrier protein) [Malonomonas rubra DSM 5091]
MKITKSAQSGTMQSSDLMIFLEPADELIIEIESTVKQQFEHLIRAKVEEVLTQHQVSCGEIRINDRGALDYAIVARLEAGLKRACEKE